MPPGPREKRHLRDLDGPLYHDAWDCEAVRVTHRCLSLRGRPAATRSLRRAMRGQLAFVGINRGEVSDSPQHIAFTTCRN